MSSVDQTLSRQMRVLLVFQSVEQIYVVRTVFSLCKQYYILLLIVLLHNKNTNAHNLCLYRGE